jgi:excinuclease UvrABC ATPase subunit
MLNKDNTIDVQGLVFTTLKNIDIHSLKTGSYYQAFRSVKSSLLDTIYAEGQRRYVETFSALETVSGRLGVQMWIK